MKVVILAGGFATRLWPLTEHRAKPLLPLAGKPLISHLVDRIPVDLDIIVSTNALFADDFRVWARGFSGRNISIFVEDSAGDVSKPGALAATSLVISSFSLQEPLLLLAGDNYVGFDIGLFIKAYRDSPLVAVYDTGSKEVAKQFGVVMVDHGHIVAFHEKPLEADSTLVSTGCYLFPARYLGDIQEYARRKADNLGGIFEDFLERGIHVDAFPFDEDWIDIGSFDSYMRAHRALQRRSSVSPLAVIRDCEIGEGVSIGDHCVVTNSILHNAIVLPGCTLADVRLRNSIVDEGCTITGLDLDHKMIRGGFRYPAVLG